MTNSRPRNIANDIIDAVETATSKWTRQKKSEERHPGMIRYRVSRMTREPRTTRSRPMTNRPRNLANDILDAVETATSKWTRQKKSEERHPATSAIAHRA